MIKGDLMKVVFVILGAVVIGICLNVLVNVLNHITTDWS